MTDTPQTDISPVAKSPGERAYDMRRLSYAGTFSNPFKAGSIRALEWFTAKVTLLRLIRSFEKSGAPHGAPFWPKAVRQMGIRIDTPPEEIALACATFGLVLGGVIGGPVAKFLLRKVALPGAGAAGGERNTFEMPHEVRLITAPALIETLALISLCLLGGQAISRLLVGSVLELPAFVCVLFIGVLLRNGLAALGWYAVFERAVSVLGNVSLALFLAMALMTLRLWELSALAMPILSLLLGQTLLMVGYAIFVTFPVLGRNYDAAVIAAGHCGFGLGATPTAIANMQAVTERFGTSGLAFLVVPMVGAFFIDIANALVIKLFVALPVVSG